ncbi:MAG: hypothetical protein L0387_28875 [Acidobacteria bacterium]|nr:hypothetical protein [Acidobacteriota bacterium]
MPKKTLVPILAKGASYDFPAGVQDEGTLKIRFISQKSTDKTALTIVADSYPNGRRVDRTRGTGGEHSIGTFTGIQQVHNIGPAPVELILDY